ncbi:RNA exonuclease 1 homolog [Myripristis murdjan]|uniref:RNA exonuclease 1 homolog n=1 Tax=Myripristis murdjan TaxID=586833 RepID=A0A667YA43_9TELE|nr:RNA exonuclease 1 homolog [Myripristis murdjan]
MLPSSGLFAAVSCPYLKRGFCERPHCLYKHANRVRSGVFGASNKSPVADFAGVQNDYDFTVGGLLMTAETKDDCLQEIERINKEIETVKHEVERQQRTLSRYKTVQDDSRSTVSELAVSEPETAAKGGYYYKPSSLPKPYSQAKKYVVDNSKPRTDLEYDPLSNFSAYLWSYNSTRKDQKAKSGQSVRRAGDALCIDPNKTLVHQAPLSRSPSPEVLDDSKEEGVLVIDLPPSPDKQRGRAQQPCGADSKTEDIEEDLILVDSPPANPEVFKGKFATIEADKAVNTTCSAENAQAPSVFSVSQECEHSSVSGSVFADLSRRFEDVRSEHLKIGCPRAADCVVDSSPEPGSLPQMSDSLQDYNQTDLVVVEEEVSSFLAGLPQCELPCGVETMNPMWRHNVSQKATFPYENAGANLSEASSQAQYLPGSRMQNTPSVLPYGQKMLSRMQAADDYASPASHLQHEAATSGGSQWEDQHVGASAKSHSTGAESLPSEKVSVKAGNQDVIIISSSSDEEEFNYSEMELSDSDPMEECYRIFMESKEEQQGAAEPAAAPVGEVDVVMPEVKVTPKALPGEKRVAHVAKRAKLGESSRPQPQVLVPLRGPAAPGSASQLSVTSRTQQRASTLAASVNGAQTFISSTSQNKPEILTPFPSQTTAIKPIPVENSYMNCLPVGTAVIEVGKNLHLILPEGTYPLPVTSTASPVTSVLTPIVPVHMSPVTPIHAYHADPVIPVHRYRPAPPAPIPARGRKSLSSSVFASSHSNPAAPPTPQAAVHVPAKPISTKRRMKQRPEEAKDKVPHDVRQRYINMFTEEFLKTSASVNDAFEKALAEEKTLYNRSVNKIKYLSVAVNALKRLKNQNAAAAKGENEVGSLRAKGRIPLNLKKLKGHGDVALCQSLKEYVLTEEMLIESNFPLQHPEKPGSAALFADNKKGTADPLKRICCRCGATYAVSQTGKHTRREECTYHYGKGVENRVPGGVETRYSCCEGVMGAPGCQVFKLHVHDAVSLDGFVSTQPRPPSDHSCPGVYSVDCEMCYTTQGLELSRVTVVNSSLQVVYDTFVRPDNEVIDYNTRFSGISEEDMEGISTSIREVQETLLSFISADTILIGHGLETDLCALKLLHGTVVDTSVVFPHHLGPPHKLSLNSLTASYLRRIIQESVCGQDTAEDAAACMELMLWRVKEDRKAKKM